MVVLTSRCPSSSCTVRMSCPSSSRWVANEWRKVWQVACLDSGPPNRVPDGALEHSLVQVVPAPLPSRVRVLAHERSRKLDPAGSSLQVLVVLPPHKFEVPRKVGLDGGGQHRPRSLEPLPARTTIWLDVQS